jgi:hypothetical protein
VSDGKHDRDPRSDVEEYDKWVRSRKDSATDHVENRAPILHGEQAVLGELLGR